MVFPGVVDGIFGDFDDEVFVSDDGLAGEAGFWFESPGFVEHVFFAVIGFVERFAAFADDDVAGGAGAGFFACVFDFDIIFEQQIADGGSGRAGEVRAVWAERFVRHDFN